MYIQPKEISEYPFYLRWFFRRQEKRLGLILLPGLFWGRMPFLQILFVLYWGHLDRKKSKLDPTLRALVQVRVAQMNSCEFCIDYNAFNFLKRSNSLDKVDALDDWKSNPLFTKKEKCALSYVEQITNIEISVPEKLQEQLKSFFSDDQIVELAALISFQNMSAKFNSALAIPSQGLCQIPKNNDA